MQRDLPVIIGVLAFLLVVAVVALSNGGSSKLSLAEKDMIPTSMILGTTTTPPLQQTEYPTTLPTAPLTITPTVSKTPSTTPPLTTRTPTPTQLVTCRNVLAEAKELGKEFMLAHENKEWEQVLLVLISEPEADGDKEALDVWLGNDLSPVSPRLYQTTTTSYEASEHRFGTIEEGRKGEDTEIRGTTRCRLTAYEKREMTTNGTKSKTDETRYIDFSLADDGTLILTAFRNKDGSVYGGKYSGFN